MKKVLAVFLCVLMTFSVLAVCASAEDETDGNVYTYASGLPRINVATEDEVLILQAGDIVRFEKVTANTSSKPKRLEIRYYPDAAAIERENISNTDWLENKTQQYNLDPANWELKEGQSASDLMAKSPNYYKTFYNYAEFLKGEVPEITVTGLNAESVFARDSAKVDRGEAPIDFALEGATFVGWALYKYTWAPRSTADASIEVYALWDRDAAPVKPDEPVDPDNPPVDPDKPVEYDTPVQEFYAKFMAKYEEIVGWIKALPVAISTVLPNYLNGIVREWLYNLFKIEA